MLLVPNFAAGILVMECIEKGEVIINNQVSSSPERNLLYRC